MGKYSEEFKDWHYTNYKWFPNQVDLKAGELFDVWQARQPEIDALHAENEMYRNNGSIAEANNVILQSRIAQLERERAETLRQDPVAHAYVVEDECQQIEWGNNYMLPNDEALLKLYAKPMPPAIPNVDWLSNVIRSADGNNTLGAGALAEKIVEAMKKATS